ncbi:MAG TPA: copper chaperone PCu(A)C, partial [Rhizomicrobium sp.]|nr:copper chaperone PCu(A)C [Rhizomicrobium sp.]
LFVATAAQGADVKVSDAWFRYLTPQVPAGGYFTIHNNGKDEVALLGAESPACGMLMMHQTMDMGGMSRMQDATRIPIPAGGEVKFAPGGFHLMCMNPTAAMKDGATVSVALRLSDKSKVTADFAVKNAQGK